jgi:hypothetical protein
MAKHTRVVVGSTSGRGPCEDCGLIAELHQVEESFPFAPGFRVVKALCLPHALGAEEVAPIPEPWLETGVDVGPSPYPYQPRKKAV